jgi:hypothetical protein
MFSNLSSIALSQLSNLSAGRYAPLWVPVATQLFYRWVRYNVYRNFYTVDHFNLKLVQQRNDLHRKFAVLEGAKSLLFLHSQL